MKKFLPLGLLVIAFIVAVPLYIQFMEPNNVMRLKRESSSVGSSTMGYAPKEMAADMAQTSTIMPYPQPYQGGVYMDVKDRTVVKTAFLSLVVDDVRASVTTLSELVSTQQGLVSNTNIYEDPMQAGLLRAELTLRVPSDKLDATLSEVRKVASKVTSESVNASDQTEQKVDLDAQLKNLRATEQQFLEILDQATTVEETLQVQQQLSQTRSQIESMQAQVDNLSGAAAYATIQVSLATEESQLPILDPSERGLTEEIVYTFKQSVKLYKNLLVGLLRVSIMALPLIVIGGVIWLFTRKKS